MPAENSQNMIFGGLMFILLVAILYRAYTTMKSGGQGLEGVISAGGFDRSKIINTQSSIDPVTGAKVVTQTDANGQKLVSTTDANGKTTTAVKAPDDTTLSKDEETVLDKVQKEAPKMMEMIALQFGRDFALIFGTKLSRTLAREIAQSGVKTGLRDTARLVQQEGADYAMKWLGYVSKESVAVSEKLAAKSTIAEASRVAAKEVFEEAEKKAVQGMAEGAEKEAAKKAAREAAQGAAEKAAEEAAQKESERVMAKAASKQGLTSAEKASTKILGKAGVKVGEKVGERLGEKVAVKIAIRAGVTAAKEGAKLAVMASAGPVGWALMAIDVVSLALDIACCGGYCNEVSGEKYDKMRDEFKGNIKAGVDDANKKIAEDAAATGEPAEPVRWPPVLGPFDKMDEITRSEKMQTAVHDIIDDHTGPFMGPIFAKLKAGLADGSIPKTGAGAAKFITDNVDTASLAQAAMVKLCPTVGGKIIEDKWCSWATKEACDGSFKWPIAETNKTDHYATWDSVKQECNKDPLSGLMRTTCEGSKKDSGQVAAFPWDPVKNTCMITKDYCLLHSMQFDEAGNKCTISKGQEVAEMLFGTTMVRGLNQMYSGDQYYPCPPGSHAAVAEAVLAAGAATITVVGAAGAAALGTYIGKTMCSSDKCPNGEEKQSGLCYADCKKATPEEKAQGWGDYNSKAADTPGAGSVMIQGMCYRCPPGYYKSSPGMCQRTLKTTAGVISKCPPGFSDSGLFCNQKTYTIGAGTVPKCKTNGCPGKWGARCCKICKPAETKCGICPDNHNRIDGLCYKKCKEGDNHPPGLPTQCRTGGGLLVQEKMKIGICPPDKDRIGALCFKRCTEYGPGWVRTVQGTCAAPQWGGLDVIATAGKDQLSYSRPPLGISYKVFPKKRKIPFGKGPHGC
jgi:hypothetical protein